jgi:hypothetical protein
MDDAKSPAPATGGSVEPLSRTQVLKQQFQIPEPPVGQRFELRDPFAEVTYRANSLEEMARTADRVGAIRFVALAPDGTRSKVSNESGEWKRQEPRLAKPERPSSAEAAKKAPAAKVLAPSASSAEPRPDKALVEAERSARAARLEASLNERYLIKRAPLRIGGVTIGETEYRHRSDSSRIAFTESTFRLSTDTNNPSVARSMVDVAEARQWQALRVSGHDDFKRMVWLEASLRQVRTVGYEPSPADQELVRREGDVRMPNRVERLVTRSDSSKPAAKQSNRGGTRKAVLVALEAVLVSKRVPERQREAVMAAAADSLAHRLSKGESHRIKVYDKSAPSRRPAVVPVREIQRMRDRPAPTR